MGLILALAVPRPGMPLVNDLHFSLCLRGPNPSSLELFVTMDGKAFIN